MPRLIDLHCRWLLQYAAETNVFDPALYPQGPARWGQTEGYLQETAAAVLTCDRSAEDWARQAQPWRALSDLITRIEAEFPGRLLIDADDLTRWHEAQAEPHALCWGLIGVEGFDALIREAADLDRLAGLFERGVRVFQMVATPSNALAGHEAAGDDRALTDLGRAFLERLASLGGHSRPILDLARLSAPAVSGVLDWFEADRSRLGACGLLRSQGAERLSAADLGRLRALGGTVALGVDSGSFASIEALRTWIEAIAEMPFLGRAGFEGIAIGTGFPDVESPLPSLGHAGAILAWLEASFDAATASLLGFENARRLIERAIGQPAEMAAAAPI